jgi:hypothetical protein
MELFNGHRGVRMEINLVEMAQRIASVRVQIPVPVIHSLVRLTLGPQPLPNRLPHRVLPLSISSILYFP